MSMQITLKSAGYGFFAIVALTCAFVLPTFVEVAPSVSSSYVFGFNNRCAVLLLLAFLAAGAAVFSKSSGAIFSSPVAPETIPTRVVYGWMLVFTAGWALMYARVRGLHGFLESVYLIDRVQMLAAGGRPYRDFEFAYGAFFLYGPRLLMMLHLSVETAYYVFWLLCLLAGPWLLARTLEKLGYPSPRRVEIFHLVCMFGLTGVACTGVNYTLFRFILASYFGLLVQGMYARGGQRNRSLAMLLSAGFTVVLLLVSPEMALSFAAGTAVYFAVFGERNKSNLCVFGVLLVLQGVVLLLANRLDVFETLKAFGGGANNFPIVPAGHILMFVFDCGLVALLVATRLREGTRGDGMLMMTAVSIPTVFAALGRCDIGHVGFAGLGIVVVAMMLASNFPRLWKGYRTAFVVLFLIVPVIFVISGGSVTKRSAAVAIVQELKLCSSFPRSKDVMLAPFGPSPDCALPLVPLIESGYFYEEVNMLTPAMVQRKVSEIEAQPSRDLILPSNFDRKCVVNPKNQRESLQVLLVFPFTSRARHVESVTSPLCAYIDGHYQWTRPAWAAGSGYEVWSRKPDALPPR